MLTTNYDLNIWDRLSWETNGEKTGGWEIAVYLIRNHGEYYGHGPQVEGSTIQLTKKEAETLTLGWGKDLGGYYAPDDDFWLDREGFFEIYKEIPERVKELLLDLPEYDMDEV